MNQAGRIKLVGSLSLLIAGCHTWTPGQVPTPAQPLEGNPAHVRVILNDGTPPIVILKPFMSADSLIGAKYTGLRGTPVRVAIPVTQIKTLEVPRFSTVRTLGLLVGLSVPAYFVIGYLIWTTLDT